MHQQTGIGCQGNQPGSQTLEQRHVLVKLDALAAAHQLQQLIGARHPVSQKAPGTLNSPKIGDPYAAASVFILVRWTDATSGRTQVLAALAGSIEKLVVRQDQVSPIRHEDPTGRVYAPVSELVQLDEQVFRLQ